MGLLGACLNQLKHNSNWNNILLKKTCMKLLDVNYRDQSAAFRIFLHNHREAKAEEERIEKLKRNIINRFSSGAFRLMVAAFKQMKYLADLNNKSSSLSE